MSEALGRSPIWTLGCWAFVRKSPRVWQVFTPKEEVVTCVYKPSKGIVTDQPDSSLERKVIKALAVYLKVMSGCPECLDSECYLLDCPIDGLPCDLVYYTLRDLYKCRHSPDRCKECGIWKKLVPEGYHGANRG